MARKKQTDSIEPVKEISAKEDLVKIEPLSDTEIESLENNSTVEDKIEIKKTEVKLAPTPLRPVKLSKMRPKIDKDTFIPFMNGSGGELFIKLKDGTSVTLPKYERGVDVTFAELTYAQFTELKATQMGFFKNNYIIFIDDPVYDVSSTEVIYALGLQQFYKDTLNPSDLEEIFNLNSSEIGKALNNLNEAQKYTAKYIAYDKISNGTLDSRKSITEVEEALGIQLIENS